MKVAQLLFFLARGHGLKNAEIFSWFPTKIGDKDKTPLPFYLHSFLLTLKIALNY